MSASKHRGFTLVEMMVVIAIIGVLSGLLLVALGPARQAARNYQCGNNMRQLSQGVTTFTSNRGRYPGSFENSPVVDPITGALAKWPWVVVIFPEIDQQVRASELRTKPDFANPNHAPGTLSIINTLLCPSDPRVPTGPQLSYVANMGRHDMRGGGTYPGILDSRGNGVFHNRFGIPQPISVRADQIKDGQDQTIMLTENVNALVWTMNNDEYETGALWFDWAEAPVPFLSDGAALPPPTPPPPPSLAYVGRPSSYHITTFNVAMCGGGVRAISQEISYSVYVRLMTSDSTKIVPATNPPAGNVISTGVVTSQELEF